MQSVLIAVGAFVLYIIAYRTYGRFLARKIFKLDDSNITPAVEFDDKKDFVPTKLEILFGHHYTSIAGTGPIVGPAIGIIWGWVPALIWVVVGSIFMGAVHDFGALIISARNKGKTIGDLAGKYISHRVQIMFLVIVFLLLLIVIAVFCLVISVLFSMYPQSVIPIWIEIPIAMALGHLVYKKGKNALHLSMIGVFFLYIFIVVGSYVPVNMPVFWGMQPLTTWTILLLIYAYIASVLPVWKLLQPRDYINGHELFVVLAVLTLAVLISRPEIVAPAYQALPEGAPPIFPFLFITIACGAISGFHSLVGSGTSSKQMSKESHAMVIGYGGMLLEGFLAVLVIISVAAGIGLAGGVEGSLTGAAAWSSHYASWGAADGLGEKVSAFVDGSAKMLLYLGIPWAIAITVMGVFVASFAATTLDTATRLQRYIITEIGAYIKFKPFTNMYVATGVAVVSAGFMALAKDGGKGGLLLWPLFGAANQLLACLGLLVLTVYLRKRKVSTVYTFIPMLIMLVITAVAMGYNIKNFYVDGFKSLHLLIISLIIIILEIFMVIESFIHLVKPLEMPGSVNPKSEINESS